MAQNYSPRIVQDGLVVCLDASQNKSYPTTDLPVKDGLALWLDASDDSTFSYSSGTSVSQWRDKSGNNRHFFQSTAGNQPTRNVVVNSRKSIRFTAASSQYLRYNSTIINNPTGGSVFVVWRTSGETQAYSSILDNYHCGANALGAGFQIERSASSNAYYWGFQQSSCTNAGRNVSYPVSYSDNTTYIYSISKNGSSVTAFSNGSSVTLESNPSATWVEDTKGWTIGCWGNGAETFGRFYNGQHCEVIIFNRGLSATEVKQVNTYLGQKWGVLNADRSIIDLSGNNNHGLLGNGTTANMPMADYYNKNTLKFDGVSDYVFVNNPGTFSSYTFMFFCRWISNTLNGSRIFGVDNFGTYTVFTPSNVAFHYNQASGTSTVLSSGVNVGLDNWCHVAVSVDPTIAKIYINGALTNGSTTVPYLSVAGNFFIGAQNTTNVLSNSNISAFQFYNRVLTDAEILQNYEAQKSKFAVSIVQQGLVLNLDAGNPYSYAGAGTTWYDTSGNSYNGTLTNGPVYSTTNSGIIVFDGSNDYVDLTGITLSISGNAARSMFTWVKTTYTGLQGFISTGTPANSQTFNLVKYGSYVGVMGYNNDFYPSSGKYIADGVWHYVGATFDGTNIRTYVDGVLDNTSGTFTYSTTGQNNYVGRSNHAGNENFINGSMGNAQIYNRALSAAEVLQNYNATKGRFGL